MSTINRYVLIESEDTNKPKVGSKLKILEKIKNKDIPSIYPNSIVTVKKINKQNLVIETFDGDILPIAITTKYAVLKV